MGYFPKCIMMLAFASLSMTNFTSLEGRPLDKSPISDNIAPTLVNSETVILPQKEAKKCKGHRSHCDKTRVISRVPVTISRSGKYCVNRDLTYTGTGAAITVVADNVTINFANHSLFLTDPAAVGVLATDVDEFTLLNDKISLNQISNLESSNAIYLVQVSKAKIDNVFTENTFRGIRLENSNDVIITNTHHKNHVGGDNTPTIPLGGIAVEIGDSNGVKLDNTYIEGSSGENQFPAVAVDVRTSHDVIISNQKHENVDQSIFISRLSTGVIVENLQANLNPFAFYSGIQIGAANDTAPVQDIIVRNATITNISAFEGWDGVNVGISSGVIFEDIIIDTNTSVASDYTPGALHFGCNLLNGCEETPQYATNGTFINVIINNNNGYGILLEAGDNLVFDNIEVTGSILANIYFGNALNSTLKNSYIGDTVENGDGLVIATESSTNAILNNVFTRNARGIFIVDGALLNRLEENHVFNNFAFGIQNDASTTQAYYNRSCGNGPNPNSNCSNITPSNNPGDPSEVGENICCFPVEG